MTLVLLGLGVGGADAMTMTIRCSLTYRLLTGIPPGEVRPSLPTDTRAVHASTMCFAEFWTFLHTAIVRFPSRRALTLEILAHSMLAA